MFCIPLAPPVAFVNLCSGCRLGYWHLPICRTNGGSSQLLVRSKPLIVFSERQYSLDLCALNLRCRPKNLWSIRQTGAASVYSLIDPMLRRCWLGANLPPVEQAMRLGPMHDTFEVPRFAGDSGRRALHVDLQARYSEFRFDVTVERKRSISMKNIAPHLKPLSFAFLR